MSLPQTEKIQVIKLSFLQTTLVGKKTVSDSFTAAISPDSLQPRGSDANPGEVALRVWLPISLSKWLSSLKSAYSKYCATSVIDGACSASTTQAHLLAVVVQEDQTGGIRRTSVLEAIPTERILFQSPSPLEED